MKKQFFRVKQLADQTFSRAGKTELLSDELAEADRHVEFLRNACTNTNKKLGACLLGWGTDDAAREKRLKKCPEYLLGHSMLESASCEENFLLREVLARCGGVAVALAQELVELDVKVEQSVVTPLQSVIDNELPSVLKHKRNLSKLVLDMDSARTRYSTAVKHSTTGAAQAKVESVREEMEDSVTKVEQCRDALASEMFQLISRETELAKIVANYVNLQKSYHENALKYLENIIPDLETYINDSDMKPVFGFPLEEHLRVTGRRVALPIELCVCALLETAMDEEGLFRVAGGALKVRRMKLSLDAGCLSLQTAIDFADPHVLAGVLKSYLRELPEPLLTHTLYPDWIAASRIQQPESRLKALHDVIQKLPEANFNNLRYLIKFLATLARNQESNKMGPQNIAIVMAPNLLWEPDQDQSSYGMNMSTTNIHSFIVDNLVTHASYLFPEDIEFYQTFQHSEAPTDQTSAAGGSGRSGSLNGSTLGHTRSSSGDTLLISCSPAGSATTQGNIKRTQSNSSLTDHSSPPHSPKPVTRRKNKAAPHPPKSNDRPDKPPRPVTVHMSSPAPARPVEPSNPPPILNLAPTELKQEEPLIAIPTSPKPTDVTQPSPKQLNTNSPKPIDIPPMKIPVKTVEVQQAPKTIEVLQQQSPKVIETVQPSPKVVEQAQPIPPVSPPPPVVVTVETADSTRRFPVAAPRTFVSKDVSQETGENVSDPSERPKPVIPERPASLRHGGSFRQNRGDEQQQQTNKRDSAPESGGCDKIQEIEIKPSLRPSSMHEKRNSFEKPERPPKPELPAMLPTVLPGSADDSTDEELLSADGDKSVPAKSVMQPSRPPRPQPPPPPPPGFRRGVAPLASESTDL